MIYAAIVGSIVASGNLATTGGKSGSRWYIPSDSNDEMWGAESKGATHGAGGSWDTGGNCKVTLYKYKKCQATYEGNLEEIDHSTWRGIDGSNYSALTRKTDDASVSLDVGKEDWISYKWRSGLMNYFEVSTPTNEKWTDVDVEKDTHMTRDGKASDADSGDMADMLENEIGSFGFEGDCQEIIVWDNDSDGDKCHLSWKDKNGVFKPEIKDGDDICSFSICNQKTEYCLSEDRFGTSDWCIDLEDDLENDISKVYISARGQPPMKGAREAEQAIPRGMGLGLASAVVLAAGAGCLVLYWRYQMVEKDEMMVIV